uniref:Uncharacterized protein n=1 Tax=Micrurus corallinus TaxID=54390 RepID=A0A2D4EN84_MICCO
MSPFATGNLGSVAVVSQGLAVEDASKTFFFFVAFLGTPLFLTNCFLYSSGEREPVRFLLHEICSPYLNKNRSEKENFPPLQIKNPKANKPKFSCPKFIIYI